MSKRHPSGRPVRQPKRGRSAFIGFGIGPLTPRLREPAPRVDLIGMHHVRADYDYYDGCEARDTAGAFNENA